MRTVLAAAVLFALVLAAPVLPAAAPGPAAPAQADPLRGVGSQPVEPFRAAGNIYYVGANGISSYIIETNAGLILLDTGTNEMAPGLRANIQKLGHALSDIKIILSSHAHWDHVEGHAAMQKATGAQVMAVGEDAAAIESGVDSSALGGPGWTPVHVDRVLADGDTVTLGDVTMTAHLTPGHTKGCTTWTTTVTENGRQLNVVFVGGTSINPGVKLIGNTRHPSIAEDYARTFQVLESLQADVFLAQHPEMYDMAGKAQRLKAGGANPFVDPDGYRRFVAAQEAIYTRQLARERAERGGAQSIALQPVISEARGLADWEPDGNGTWTVRGNTLVLDKAGVPGGPIRRPAAIALLRSEPLADVTMRLELRSTAPVDLDVRDVLLIFDYQSPSRFYYVHLARKTDEVHNGIFLVNDADRRRIDDGRGVPRLRDQAWHRVRLEREAASGAIRVFFDDSAEPILSATDTTLRSGRVGVGSFDETGEFRAFEITGTPAN